MINEVSRKDKKPLKITDYVIDRCPDQLLTTLYSLFSILDFYYEQNPHNHPQRMVRSFHQSHGINDHHIYAIVIYRFTFDHSFFNP